MVRTSNYVADDDSRKGLSGTQAATRRRCYLPKDRRKHRAAREKLRREQLVACRIGRYAAR